MADRYAVAVHDAGEQGTSELTGPVVRQQILLGSSLNLLRQLEHTAREFTVRTSQNTTYSCRINTKRDFNHGDSPDDADESAQLGATATTLGSDGRLLVEREVHDDVVRAQLA